ncbi:MAG: hypothetical protein KME06_19010 [Kastovskya adunca ATA6-11-RM4]|nr:hypothetical protein [Kastovskya adunca ATA6-11-RM4]
MDEDALIAIAVSEPYQNAICANARRLANAHKAFLAFLALSCKFGQVEQLVRSPFKKRRYKAAIKKVDNTLPTLLN